MICLEPRIQPSIVPVTGNTKSTEDLGEDLLLQEVTKKELLFANESCHVSRPQV